MQKKQKPGEYAVKLRIKKGDTVQIISGRDRGKTGTVLHAYPAKNKVTVEGVNIVVRHQKARQSGRPGRTGVREMQEGGRIQKPAPLFASKVMIVCPQCHRPTRVGYAYAEGDAKLSSRKYRVCKHPDCAKSID